ncbi:hypothetical protein N7U66_20505 [Lacinutrix neustonica]|uniref:Uncharacterized protein n=1 Tax=Lacinutrix neustonica TaxID=2980107 RepID=A0A9E8MW96_9FLAO|nr:hypothetical protein [Lacinutrix neustonica]WAC02125.1 hypothetical protein N7U66_20505 [Lacinutrix neustonica]
MKLKFTLLLLTFSMSLSFAQYSWTKGELILKNGTTLTGLIKLPTVSKDLIAFNGKEKVKFKTDKKAKAQKFEETQVNQIVFRNSDTETAIFEYIPISKKRTGIFKIITKGKATLYAKNVSVNNSSGPAYMGGVNGGTPMYYMYSYADFDEFYVLRENEEIASPLITIRPSRSFRHRAKEYFADCTSVVLKLKNKDYRKEDIKEMVEAYNNCQ